VPPGSSALRASSRTSSRWCSGRPPRSRTTRLIDTRLLVHGYLFLGLIEAAAALSAYFFVIGPAAWHSGGPPDRTLYLQSTTACLSAIVVMQIVNVFLWRDTTESIWRLPLARNRLILAGIALETAAILAIVYTPVGHLLFGTAPLPASVWIFIAPFAAGMLVIEEARKALCRRMQRCRTT
jgi:sodium/potassium-transporting ATPase subunit alpha